jgi:pre-rRNA-processing protein TSR2
MATISPAAQVSFARAVIARLAVWPVLTVAVESSWGGPESKQKRTWMAGEIVDAFGQTTSASAELDEIYIEELLLQMMSDEFDCVVDDLSGEEVAKDIIKLWNDTKDGSIDQSVKIWEDKEKTMSGKKIQFAQAKRGNDTDWVEDDEEGSSDEDDGGDDDEGEDAQMDVDEAPALVERRERQEPIVDEEGFTLVQGKGKGKKR